MSDTHHRIAFFPKGKNTSGQFREDIRYIFLGQIGSNRVVFSVFVPPAAIKHSIDINRRIRKHNNALRSLIKSYIIIITIMAPLFRYS
jgi:hypothetical protein